MVRSAVPGVALAFLLFCSGVLQAQETEKPLTNGDVLSMAKAGLPESTVVLAIQLAGRRGSTNFDTSPSALIELKNGGVTEKVLNAVLNAQARKPVPPESPIPGLPAKPGIYYRGPSGWVGLPSCLLWPAFRTSLNVTARFWGTDNVMVLPDPQAQVQISELTPTVYVRGQPEAGWRLVRLVKKRDRRELWLARSDLFAAAIRFRQSDIREIGFTTLGRGVFTITPKAELDSGEYLLCTEVRAAQRLLQCYEFGIRQGNRLQPSGAS